MTANDAVPGDAASIVASVSTGPSTKRSRVSRKAKAPTTSKAKAQQPSSKASLPAIKAPTNGTKAPSRSKAETSVGPKAKARQQPHNAQSGARKAPAGAGRRVPKEAPIRRTSEILLQILEDNPQEFISVQQIVSSLGTTSFGTSLMVFSIPEVIPIPVPGLSAIVALPTGILAAQMITGSGEIRLPKALLKRSIPRKAFAAAVKAILPFLKRAEKGVRPRWQWATNPVAKRLLGVLVFVLACVIALPIPMTNMPPAIAIFIIGLGLVERDGKLISLGVALGLASIALIGGAFLGIFSLFGGSL